MYLDNRPASTFQHTPGWAMPTAPQPPGTLKRPPVTNAGASSSSSLGSRPQLMSSGSSSSSLGGLEQHVPSFQSFIKRTPSVDSEQDKPLPPTPLEAKQTFIPLMDGLDRRSSSVYSRTPSQFAPQTPPWKAEDPDADSPLLFRPVTYSASSPDLSRTSEISAPFLLEPRTFSPLIESPRATTVASNSPPESRTQSLMVSMMSPAPEPRAPSPIPLPPIDTKIQLASPKLTSPPRTSPLMYHGPRQPVKTVSLEKAKENLKAPGTVPLLPEELRAQALKKVRSQGHIRLESIDIFGGAPKTPQPPAIPTMIDRQGRERSLQTPPDVQTSKTEYGFPSPSLPKTSAAYNAFPVGTGPVREMAPPRTDDSSESRATWRQLSQDGTEEPRGRPLGRQQNPGPRQSQTLAKEYHSLLSQQQHRQASESPGYSSDESIRTHMKMVPQPLFGAKQPPRSRRSDSSRKSNSSVSPFNIHKRGRSDGSTSSTNRSTGFGLRLSLETSESKHRTSSTTGMIPISPPTDMEVKRSKPPDIDTNRWQPNPRKPKNHIRENSRESSFYPHIMRRKPSKKQEPALPPGKPLLAAEVIAQKLKTPESTPDTSPMQSSPIVTTHRRKESSAAGSEKEKKKFLHRFAKGRRRSSALSNRSPSPGKSQASATSPHLFPSPVKTAAVHLGWSDAAKRNFDESRSPPSTPRGGPPRLTHITAPMKPMDDSKSALTQEPESPSSARRPSLFGSVLESWRENKAARRREDLKKMIRVVPVESPGEGGEEKGELKRRSSMFPAGAAVSLLPRRSSTYGWM